MSIRQDFNKYSFRKPTNIKTQEITTNLKLTKVESNNSISDLKNPGEKEEKDKFNLEKAPKTCNLTSLQSNPAVSNPESNLSKLEVKDTPVSTNSNTVNKANFTLSSNEYSNKSCAPFQKPLRALFPAVIEDYSILKRQIEEAENRKIREKFENIAKKALVPVEFNKEPTPTKFSFKENKPDFKVTVKEIPKINIYVLFKQQVICLKFDSYPIEANHIISQSVTEFGLIKAIDADFYLKSRNSKIILQKDEFLKEDSGTLTLKEYHKENIFLVRESNYYPIFPANFAYKLSPSRLELTEMTEKQLKAVKNLKIENYFGNIRFEGEIDLSKADFTGFEIGLGKFERGNLEVNLGSARVEMCKIIEEYGILPDSTYFSEVKRQVKESGVNL